MLPANFETLVKEMGMNTILFLFVEEGNVKVLRRQQVERNR